jgi:4-hydroxy-tetrahydrodipicolinate synthase
VTPVSPSATAASVPPSLSGLIAAVATPLTSDGTLDIPTFERIVTMLADAGVAGVCLGGATAEYPHTSREERIALIGQVARRVPEGTPFVVGVGAASPRDVVPLSRASFDAGATAVLLSMPLFFPYAQDDLDAFCRNAAAQAGGPLLLYDLPSFTTPLETSTILTLLEDVPGIVGIKDSSGNRERLKALVARRGDRPWRLIVGDDNVLAEGLAAGWDGSISGVAGFCPELLVALTRAALERDTARAAELGTWLQELIAQISVFPTPWGIRIGLAARGIDTGPLPLPLSSRRVSQIAAFHAWLPAWLDRLGEALGQPVAGR